MLLFRWAQANPARMAALAIAAVGGLAAASYALHLAFSIASSLFLLVVVLLSLSGSFAWSAIVSVLAAACLDFFTVDPLFSFAVAERPSLTALVSFLATSLVITRLVTRIRHESATSLRHRDRIDRLYGLAQQLLALEPESAVGETLLEPFVGVFGVQAVCIFDGEKGELHALGASRADLAERTRAAFRQDRDQDDPAHRVSVRRLRVGGKTTAAMGFEGLEEPELTAGPLMSLAATSQERTRAFRKAREAAATAQTEVYRSALLDALAQEFKTPLATILTAAGGIREAGSLRAPQIEMADAVETEAVRLGTLTTRLLGVARLDREDVRPRMEICDVAAVAAGVVEQYRRLAQDRPVCCVCQTERIEAWADAELLRLALSQLLDNAGKYSLPGSEITVEIGAHGGMFSVRVSNCGSSIPAVDRQRIFERFYRGEDARQFTVGSGLGLYVARKIALAHGGTLELEADGPPDRVTFRLAIPIAESDSEKQNGAAYPLHKD